MNIIKTMIFLFCAIPGMAQSNIYAKAVFGSYSMGDMKEFQEELLKDYNATGLPLKTVSDFPVSLQAEVGMDFPSKRYTVGFLFNYSMTQGRIHYGDYSGETFADQNLDRILIGVKGASPLSPNLDIYAKVGAGFSTLDLNFKTTINGSPASEQERHKFKALGVSVEPGLQFEYPWRRIILSASGGYEFNFNDKTKYGELSADSYLVNDNDEAVKINWSGVRFAIGLAYVLRPDQED